MAGILVASSTNSVSQTLGPQYLLPAYAAAFLGTTQIKMGRFNIWGSMIAIFLLGTGVIGLQLASGSQICYTDYFNGAALVIAVGGSVFVEKRKGWRQKRRQMRQLNASTLNVRSQPTSPPPS